MGLFNRGVNEDVLRAMHEAGWFPADPITLRTSIEIVGSVVLDRPYRDAPVSPLYYNGKKEQLAFEKPDGRSLSHRNLSITFFISYAATNADEVLVGVAKAKAGMWTGSARHRWGSSPIKISKV